MNISSIVSVVIVGFILLFIQKIEGSSLSLLFQPIPLLIVFGGTFCAAFLNFPAKTMLVALKSSFQVFNNKSTYSYDVINEILELAHIAHRQGLFSLKNSLENINDNFLKRGIYLALDINNPQLLYDILSAEISYEEEQELINSRVFEALGGYAPTFGVTGAVMGLIQVMKHIEEPTLLASGIGTAFMATLYGVGAANILFLPIAGHLKLKIREKILLKEVILQGILSIHMAEHPIIIEEKLIAYLKYHNREYEMSSYYGAKQNEA